MKDNKLTFEEWVKENYETFTEDEMYENYAQWIDDIYPEVEIGFSKFKASTILRELEPTTYRVGFSDYTESLGDNCFEIGNDYVLENEDELREFYEHLEEDEEE